MSMLNKMFGSKKAQATPTEAQEQVKNTIEMLNKKSAFIESQVEKQHQIAVKNAKKDKRLALNALKKKKMYEKQLNQIDGTITMLDNQLQTLDSAQLNMETMKTMKAVTGALKDTHKNMNIDDIYKIKDDMEEQQELSQEVSNIISQPTGLDLADNDELLAELEQLENEQDDEALNELLNVSVPDDQLPKQSVAASSSKATEKKKEKDQEVEDQLKKLEAWLS